MRKNLRTHSRRPRPARSIHVIDNPQDPEQLIVCPARRWDGIVASLLASSLDRQLAAGRAPQSSHLLATRADQLASTPVRRKLAQEFDHFLEVAKRSAVPRSPRLLVLRDHIADVEPDLREMLTKLLTPCPTSARGVAMARLLLTDGTGPLFNHDRSAHLRDAIHTAIEQLDQAGGVMTRSPAH